MSAETLRKNSLPFLIGAAIGTGAAYLWDKYPRRNFSNNPKLPLRFKVADYVLEAIAMPHLEVITHHWHWNNIPHKPEFEEYEVNLKGAPSGNPHNNPFFGVIAHLGGRPYGYIVNVENPEKGYHIGFRNPNGSVIRRCSIELKEPVMLLTGPDDGCTALAMDKFGNPLKLKMLTEQIHRNNKPPGIRIL